MKGGYNQFIQKTKKIKANEKPKRKRRRSKNNTTVHETIKTKCLDRPEIFIDKEVTLVHLDIYWGDTMVASPSLRFCTFFTSLHHSSFTPENFPSYKTSHNFLLATLVHLR